MKTIQLTKGMVAIVDDDDYETLIKYAWKALKPSARSPWYAMRKKSGKIIYMHRFLLGEGKYISDHINGNGLDNRRHNLRKANFYQSSWNTNKKRVSGVTSKFKGVGWVKRDSVFQARIRTEGGRRISLGYFSDDRAAALAYNKMAIKLFGEFAKLNDV